MGFDKIPYFMTPQQLSELTGEHGGNRTRPFTIPTEDRWTQYSASGEAVSFRRDEAQTMGVLSMVLLLRSFAAQLKKFSLVCPVERAFLLSRFYDFISVG